MSEPDALSSERGHWGMDRAPILSVDACWYTLRDVGKVGHSHCVHPAGSAPERRIYAANSLQIDNSGSGIVLRKCSDGQSASPTSGNSVLVRLAHFDAAQCHDHCRDWGSIWVHWRDCGAEQRAVHSGSGSEQARLVGDRTDARHHRYCAGLMRLRQSLPPPSQTETCRSPHCRILALAAA